MTLCGWQDVKIQWLTNWSGGQLVMVWMKEGFKEDHIALSESVCVCVCVCVCVFWTHTLFLLVNTCIDIKVNSLYFVHLRGPSPKLRMLSFASLAHQSLSNNHRISVFLFQFAARIFDYVTFSFKFISAHSFSQYTPLLFSGWTCTFIYTEAGHLRRRRGSVVVLSERNFP